MEQLEAILVFNGNISLKNAVRLIYIKVESIGRVNLRADALYLKRFFKHAKSMSILRNNVCIKQGN